MISSLVYEYCRAHNGVPWESDAKISGNQWIGVLCFDENTRWADADAFMRHIGKLSGFVKSELFEPLMRVDAPIMIQVTFSI